MVGGLERGIRGLHMQRARMHFIPAGCWNCPTCICWGQFSGFAQDSFPIVPFCFLSTNRLVFCYNKLILDFAFCNDKPAPPIFFGLHNHCTDTAFIKSRIPFSSFVFGFLLFFCIRVKPGLARVKEGGVHGRRS